MSVSATPLNRLRQLWREGRPAFGAIATIPSVQTVQIMARSLDWIIVDLEHGPIGLTEAHAMIAATTGTPCTPLGADRGERAMACEGTDGHRRLRHQFPDDHQSRGG
ncbi:2-keto-3-deoxy-L-rhamnonate aldolase RhmA [Bradyrhizobium sp. F1.13.4]